MPGLESQHRVSKFGARAISRRELFFDDPRSVGIPEVVETDGEPSNVRVPVVETQRLRAYLDGPSPADRLIGLAPEFAEFAEFLRHHRLDHRFLVLGIPNPLPVGGSFERRRVHLAWRGEEVDWFAPVLTSLMRGDAVPRGDVGSRAFTRRYLRVLAEIEHAVLCVARARKHVPTNREIREAYRAIRRRPDGRGGGPVGDVVWQALAVSLARCPFSALEVEAVLSRLESSVRLHARWPGGTGYVQFLRATLSPVA